MGKNYQSTSHNLDDAPRKRQKISERDHAKTLKEYRKYQTGTRGIFYVNDLDNIFRITLSEQRGNFDAFAFGTNCLAVGFMIGYRRGKREQREKMRAKNKES